MCRIDWGTFVLTTQLSGSENFGHKELRSKDSAIGGTVCCNIQNQAKL